MFRGILMLNKQPHLQLHSIAIWDHFNYVQVWYLNNAYCKWH